LAPAFDQGFSQAAAFEDDAIAARLAVARAGRELNDNRRCGLGHTGGKQRTYKRNTKNYMSGGPSHGCTLTMR